MTATMDEAVICYCLKCKHELGQYYNSWIVVGNTYYSPVSSVHTSGLIAKGHAKPVNFPSQKVEW